MLTNFKYVRDDLDVDFYPKLFNPKIAQEWFDYLESIVPHQHTRTSIILGNPGLIYKVSYRGITKETIVTPWNTLPIFNALKSFIEDVTKQKFTVCVIQRYPHGNIGIAPHKDKEMVPGTLIAGLSFGATRTLDFIKPNYDNVSIKLNSGSLYVLNPPTNQFWLHSIRTEPQVKEVRYSLTFRNY